MEYTVTVAETARYTIGAVAASPNNNSTIRFKLDGNDITGSVVIPNTGGWQTYKTIQTKGVNIEAGTHILQLFEETGGFNLDKITFEKEPQVVTGISETKSGLVLKVYPNPASTQVFIESSQSIIQSSIYDLTGKLIETIHHQSNDGNVTLNTSGLAAGVYILNISSANENNSLKLVIKTDTLRRE